MEYIIVIILIIIVALTIGLILRKRIYDMVDKQESWKLDIMGRNVAEQISRIKRLNLSGETQERFETWKTRWELIVTKELPDIEEYLLDAEEAADKFQISKAKKLLLKVENILKSIEKNIEEILTGLEELLESEKTSRKEAEEIEPEMKAIRKQLSQNRYQYGKAELYFDNEIDELENALVHFHELIDEGNYTKAKELVNKIKEEKYNLAQQIDKFPSIYKKCKHELPAQLDNLLAGVKEMKEQGYRVEHLGFEKEIHTYQDRNQELLKALENGFTDESESILTGIEERIEEMFQLLEKEAIAKNYLDTKLPSFTNLIEIISEKYDVTKNEVEELKKAYFFVDSDMEKYLSLGKEITRLKENLEEMYRDMENESVGHSELLNRVEKGFIKIEELEKDLEEFKVNIKNFRKDELEAREELAEMRKKLYSLQRKLKKSNIPGVPTFIWNRMEETANKNNHVFAALEKRPLDMVVVQETLRNAKQSLEQTIEQTDMMLDQAYLTEQVIQYANRYRRKNPVLAAKLIESERLFRSYEYELALETAAKAIEEVEPGALKKIEETQQVVLNS